MLSEGFARLANALNHDHTAQLPPLALGVDLIDVAAVMNHGVSTSLESAMPFVKFLEHTVLDSSELALGFIGKQIA